MYLQLIIELNQEIQNANAIQIVSDHECLLVVFEITIDEDSGFLSICYQSHILNLLLSKIVEKIFNEGKIENQVEIDIKTLISELLEMRVESNYG